MGVLIKENAQAMEDRFLIAATSNTKTRVAKLSSTLERVSKGSFMENTFRDTKPPHPGPRTIQQKSILIQGREITRANNILT